jgi:diguanylate cyclase (GGDEF)-like protein
MAAFLSAQLDFIFFFYGLAFILLGGVCFAVTGIPGPRTFFGLLGAFAVAHGVGEWLDLIALLAGESLTFAVIRTALMAASYLLLLEFARRQAIRFGLRVPGIWLHAALALFVGVCAAASGVDTANVAARYAIGFPGAMGTAWVFLRHSRERIEVPHRWWFCGAIGFALYGVAAGLIVPTAHFWPADTVNYGSFTRVTGVPIQLVRGLIACWITTSLWMIWKRMVAINVDSKRYTASQQHILVWTLIATGLILSAGWTLTEFLGGIYTQSVQEESTGDIRLLAGLLNREAVFLDAMSKAVAGSPDVLALLANGRDAQPAQSALQIDAAASGAKLAYIANNQQTIVASFVGGSAQAWLPAAGGYHFVPDGAGGSLDYYASTPILSRDQTVLGAAVFAKSLSSFDVDLGGFTRAYFLVDPDGVVMLTNRPQFLRRALWPAPAKLPTPQGRKDGQADRTMFDHEIEDATWNDIDGQRQFVRRQFAGLGRWSLVLVMPNSLIFANRFLGIIITLLVSIMMMIYLYGRERSIRDHVEMENRLNLREVAEGLQLQATTDPLTRLYNRLKFNEALSREMARSKRHKTPLSLVLLDVDHFKAVNDSHGHQVGDAVLVSMAELISRHIRPTDLLARWGGEEFVILSPGSTGPTARAAAERLRTAIQEVVFAQAGTLSCSFGVGQYRDGESGEAVVARADAALYRAKIGGRNRVELAV